MRPCVCALLVTEAINVKSLAMAIHHATVTVYVTQQGVANASMILCVASGKVHCAIDVLWRTTTASRATYDAPHQAAPFAEEAATVRRVSAIVNATILLRPATSVALRVRHRHCRLCNPVRNARCARVCIAKTISTLVRTVASRARDTTSPQEWRVRATVTVARAYASLGPAPACQVTQGRHARCSVLLTR